MWNPFRAKKNGKHEDDEEEDEAKPLVKRLQEPDTSDLRAQEVLEASEEACQTSQVLDEKALEKLKLAKKKTETARKRVKLHQEHISGVLEEKEASA
jgi:hypothetical protein